MMDCRCDRQTDRQIIADKWYRTPRCRSASEWTVSRLQRAVKAGDCATLGRRPTINQKQITWANGRTDGRTAWSTEPRHKAASGQQRPAVSTSGLRQHESQRKTRLNNTICGQVGLRQLWYIPVYGYEHYGIFAVEFKAHTGQIDRHRDRQYTRYVQYLAYSKYTARLFT